jgi:segregation and condensation protein A
MDLLLHLVKEQEVDVCDLSISLLLKGYLDYLEGIEEIDLAEATDFLVMASTLLEIKSRQVLPGQEVDLEEVLDPRDNLVSQLLEFRRFREAAWHLGENWRLRARMHGRGRPERLPREEPPEDDLKELEDLDAWDLLRMYAAIVDQLGVDRNYRVVQDRKPIRHYLEKLLEGLRREGRTTFDRLFDGKEGKEALIGTFVALLEVVKNGYARCVQEEVNGRIEVEWQGPGECTVEQVLVGMKDPGGEEEEEEEEEAAAEAGPPPEEEEGPATAGG